MKYLFHITLLMLTLSVVSCKKENETEDEQPANAVITLNTPWAMQHVDYGDSVKITGTIIADKEMHGYNVSLKNNATGAFPINQGYHEHASSFVINESWKNTVTDTSYMTVDIQAAIDHDGSVVTQQRIIICYPQ